MSYDKCTDIVSHVDAIVRTLEALKQPYTIRSIDRVHCRGRNDLGVISIRRLEYADRVVLERMVQTADCDTDDVLESHEFSRAEDPGSAWRWIVDLPEDAPWPGPYDYTPRIDDIRNALDELVSSIDQADDFPYSPSMNHRIDAALASARAVLKKSR